MLKHIKSKCMRCHIIRYYVATNTIDIMHDEFLAKGFFIVMYIQLLLLLLLLDGQNEGLYSLYFRLFSFITFIIIALKS